MKLEPIRLRLVPRQPKSVDLNPREAFWHAIKLPDELDGDISSCESKLRRQFGSSLRKILIDEFAEQLLQIRTALYKVESRDLERFLEQFFKGRGSEKIWDQSQVLDAFTRLLVEQQQIFRESPALQRARECFAAACSVTFSVQLAGYSSLNLDLSLRSIKGVAEAFENDFDSFRVFLEAFVPQAFTRLFGEPAADRLEFNVHIPASYEHAFKVKPDPMPVSISETTSVVSTSSSARERAEWLWRLANGSLLIPLLLALVVMYFGMFALKEIMGSQNEALKPILEHQLKLLEEDRHRLFREPPRP